MYSIIYRKISRLKYCTFGKSIAFNTTNDLSEVRKSAALDTRAASATTAGPKVDQPARLFSDW